MSKILNLSARLTTGNVSKKETEERVRDALSGIEGLVLGNLKISDLNPSQSRVVRASLDLMMQKINEHDESAEENLTAYSLKASDVDEKTISETINSLFP